MLHFRPQLSAICLTAAVIALVNSAGHPANPVGSFDVIANGAAHGWAWDADEPDTALTVDFYAGGPAGQGAFLGSALADQPRPDLVGTPYENHAFHHPLPASVLDGRSLVVFAHARNVGPGADAQLPGSPELVLDERAEIWMCRSNPFALAASNEWEFVKHNLDVIKLYVDEVNNAPMSDLRDLVDVLEKYNIKIAIELGGLVDWRAGAVDGRTGESRSAELSFSDEWAKVRRLTDPVAQGGAGGTVAYLDIDGPIRRMLYPFNVEQSHHTLATATDQLAQVLQLWRQAYPDLEFMLLTNFPNWGWKGGPAYHNFGYTPGTLGYGDYFPALQMAMQKAEAAGVPFRGLTIDNPYEYAIKSRPSNQPAVVAGVDFMARLRDVEDYAEGVGLEVNLIYNSETAGVNGTDQAYYNQTMAFIDAHMTYSATPLRYIIQSWYPHPTAYVPETGGHTMAHLTRDVILKLREHTASIGSPVGAFESCDWLEARGWAVDYDDPSGSVEVHFYLDAMPGMGGTFLGATTADQSHPERGLHGFAHAFIPGIMRAIAEEGEARKIYAIGLDLAGPGGPALLRGSPLIVGPGGFPFSRAGTWTSYR